MSWSKYHLRYYHHIVLALWHYHRKKDMSCSDILIKNRNITQRPDVGQSLSISLLCFHCWPKPQSSPLTLENIGLIKDQFNEITLWGNTSDLRPQSSERRCDLRSCPSCCWQSLGGPQSSSTGESGRTWRLTGGPWITGDIPTRPPPPPTRHRGGTVSRTSVTLLRRAFYIHITCESFSFDLLLGVRGRVIVEGRKEGRVWK